MPMRDPFLDLSGAVEAPGTGVAAHFGSPLIEQRELEAGNAVVSLTHHGVVRVTGADRLSWLDSMTSQSLTSLQPGFSTETLLLSPQGRIERAIRVVDDGECTWLLVDAGSAEPLAEFLTRMRFALRVDVENASEEYATLLAFEGGTALGALRQTGLPIIEWRDPWAGVAAGGVQYSCGDHASAGWSATHLILRRSDVGKTMALIDDGEFTPAGLSALHALEIRAWRPTVVGDVDERSLPHELDWLRTAVHLTKGCYRGQETVAKVHNLGHPPRRLVFLHLDGSGSELPEAGSLIYLAGTSQTGDARPSGRITRAALHHEWGPIALALLKRSVPEDAELEVVIGDAADGPTHPIAAAQETIVPADAGATRDIPRLRRL